MLYKIRKKNIFYFIVDKKLTSSLTTTKAIATTATTNVSRTKICEVCLIEVAINKWTAHVRTLAHKNKLDALQRVEGFKVCIK